MQETETNDINDIISELRMEERVNELLCLFREVIKIENKCNYRDLQRLHRLEGKILEDMVTIRKKIKDNKKKRGIIEYRSKTNKGTVITTYYDTSTNTTSLYIKR